MAASTGVINGNTIGLYIGTDLIALGKSSDLNLSMSPIDVTTKDSAGKTEIINGLTSFSFNGEFLFDNDSTFGWEDVYDAWLAGTALTVVDQSGTTGDVKYTGTCYITDATKTNPANDVVGFTASFAGTSTLAKATIS